MKRVAIVSAVRTPIGSFNGSLKDIPATRLGSIAVEEAIKRAGIEKDEVDEVIMGNVLSAGLGQAPARQAALGAGLPQKVRAVTVNKVCGSGMQAVIMGARAIMLGDSEIVVAGGMESMSRAPYLLEEARSGYRLGHGKLVDSMIKDGLWDVYNDFHMGSCAELLAEKYGFSREEQDEYAKRSYERALSAQMNGKFKNEIVPVTIKQKKETITVDEDEEPKRADFEKMKVLQPVFKKDGTVTAANASKINDGASAIVLMSEEMAKQRNKEILGIIRGYAGVAVAPEWFTIAPVYAIENLLRRAGARKEDIDLFEINEAFSSVAMVAIRELKLDDSKVNINGGAVALGHPIGASGARIITTLLHAMRDMGKKNGIAAICIGGGEALAMLFERV